jgi:hypothetical protein
LTSGTLVEAPSLFGRVGEGGTLDALIVSVWEGVKCDREVECPVCAEEMKPEYGVHARAIGGRCSACASTLR